MIEDTNAVRGRVLEFPRGPQLHEADDSDQVVVRHAGETRVYETPQALAAAFRSFDPVAAERLRHAHASAGRAHQRVQQAKAQTLAAREAAARAYTRGRRTTHRALLCGILIGAGAVLTLGAVLAGSGL